MLGRLAILTFIYFLSAGVTPAYAYIDPGTGSFIIQFLISGILAALFTLKMYWGKVKNFFRRDPNPPSRTTKMDDGER